MTRDKLIYSGLLAALILLVCLALSVPVAHALLLALISGLIPVVSVAAQPHYQPDTKRERIPNPPYSRAEGTRNEIFNLAWSLTRRERVALRERERLAALARNAIGASQRHGISPDLTTNALAHALDTKRPMTPTQFETSTVAIEKLIANLPTHGPGGS